MDKKWVVSLGYNTNKLEKRLLNARRYVACPSGVVGNRSNGHCPSALKAFLSFITSMFFVLPLFRDESASDAVISPWSQPMQYLCSPEDSDSPGEVWN